MLKKQRLAWFRRQKTYMVTIVTLVLGEMAYYYMYVVSLKNTTTTGSMPLVGLWTMVTNVTILVSLLVSGSETAVYQHFASVA